MRVSNDDAGVITFRAAVPNRPVMTDDMRVYVNVDADSDPATGVGGRDYWLLVDPIIYKDHDVHPFFCANAICGGYPPDRPAPSGVLSHVYASGPTITIDGSYLGDARRFRFQIVVVDGIVLVPGAGFDFTNSHRDPAPDDGWWTYGVRIGPSRLLVKRFSTEPATPRAGKTFSVRLHAVRDDIGAAVTRGRIACRAAISGMPLRLRRRAFVGTAAVCSWFIPVEAKGRMLRGSIAVMFSGKNVSKAFARKIG